MSAGQFDVIVVGAGPAGSMAALHSARNGAKTALLDKAKLPREKLCGGGVNAWVIDKLAIPDSIIERTITRGQVIVGEKELPRVPWPETLAWRTVMRAKFDYFLTKRAVDAGAVLLEETPVEAVTFSEDKSVSGVKTPKGNLRAKVVIGCDGVLSTVARTSGFWVKWFNNDPQRWKERCAYCAEAHFRLPDDQIEKRIGNTLYFFYERGLMGYHWIFPKKGIITVGTGCAAKSMTKKPLSYFSDFIRGNAVAAKLLKGAELIDRVRGAYVPFSGTFTPSYGDGILLAGDSAGMVCAATGEGIYFAVRAGIAAGEVASEAIQSDDATAEFLSSYEKRWKTEIGKQLDIQVEFLNRTQSTLKAMGLYTIYALENSAR